ncbi:MAG: FtsX-like permease family protein [Gaiellaceae bacterium]
MTSLRRALYPVWLAGSRLRARGGRSLLVVLGVATGAAALAAVLAGSVVAQDRSLAGATAAVPDLGRQVRAGWLGIPTLPDEEEPVLDRRARRALGSVLPGLVTEVVTFRQSTLGGAFIALAGADGLSRWVHVASGRLPRRCDAARCEVLQIGGQGEIPSVPGLPLVWVGTGRLATTALFGDFFGPPANAFVRSAVGFREKPLPPLLVAEGVDGLVELPELAPVYRSYAWILPIDPDAVHPWDVTELERRVRSARSELQASTIASSWELKAPLEELAAAREEASVSGRRLLLIGGEAAALLLAFAALAATRLRRDVAAARIRLAWFGARRWKLELETAAESAGLALAGATIGWLAGLGLGTLVAHRAGSPASDVLGHSALSAGGLALGGALAAAAAMILFAAVRSGRGRSGRSGPTPVDLVALGALAVVIVGAARGDADSVGAASAGGTGLFLLLLPGLVAFIAAVVLVRVLEPALRLGERLVRRRSVAARLAFLSLARNPGHAGVAAAFLVVSLGLALFAETYRSTLVRGQADQAAFTLPADFVLRELPTSPARVADVATPAALAGLRTDPVAVIRRSGNVSGLNTGRGVNLLGLPASRVPGIDGWRSDFSGSSLDTLARRIAPRQPAAMRGPLLPENARVLRFQATAAEGSVSLVANVRTPAGGFLVLDLGEVKGRTRTTLQAPIPPAARGGRIVALTLNPPPGQDERADHDIGRGVEDGMLTLEPPEVLDAAESPVPLVVDYAEWIGVFHVEPSVSGDSVRLDYTLSNDAVSRFRPRQPSDEEAVRAIVSPRLAAAAGRDGRLPLQIADQQLVVQVTGTAARFPGVSGDFAVADAGLLESALNSTLPGSGTVNELWVDAPVEEPAFEAALRTGPFGALDLQSQTAREQGLRADPLARGTLLTLVAAALVALALALVGLVLGVVSDLRDERGELFDLEAQGAAPSLLRRQARLRAAVVAGVGIAGGLLTAVVLSRVVVDLVRLTANATQPEPPLRLAVDWPLIGLAVGAYAVVAALLVALATRTAFRSSAVPRRVPEVAA